jgi:L-aspartate oxidase
MRALAAAARERPDIRVLEGWRLVDLLTCGAGTRDARAAGVLLEGADGGRLAVVAPRVVLATGGIGACFDRTTNPPCAQGAGLAAGARQGVRLADLEFVQFHPTALVAAGDPRMLLTEALRGAGAVLVDDAGEPFMAAIHPDADLAPRDVVARGVAAREIAGRPVFLDATGVDRLAARFPGAVAAARTAGLDAHRQPLPVTTAAHFHMGGIATDAVGATSLPGLWACGEVAATGLHGGNRLASNSLLEGLVFGERIARAIRKGSLAAPRGPLLVPRRAGLARADAATIADPARIAGLRRLVGASLGVLRSATGLATAQARLAEWRAQSREEEDVATVAMLLVEAALARRESRGAHFRTDHPEARPGRAARSFVVPPAAPAAALVAEWCRVA